MSQVERILLQVREPAVLQTPRPSAIIARCELVFGVSVMNTCLFLRLVQHRIVSGETGTGRD